MAIMNDKNMKFEKEMDCPNGWESNVIYERKNGTVVKMEVEDDKEGGE